MRVFFSFFCIPRGGRDGEGNFVCVVALGKELGIGRIRDGKTPSFTHHHEMKIQTSSCGVCIGTR